MDTIQCQLTNSQTLLENTHTYIQHLKKDQVTDNPPSPRLPVVPIFPQGE